VERTGQPKTREHLAARAGGSSRRSEDANLATSLAGSRGRRMVHRRMSSRERRMVLLWMSCLASSAPLDAMTRPSGCRTRTAARMWYLEPSCMLLIACMTSNGRSRRVSPVSGCSGEGPLTEPTAAAQHGRRERLKVLRVFGRLPVTDSATRSRGRRPKSLRGGNRGGVCAGGGVGQWGFSADVGPDAPVWNRGDG
jgi:hypothetical protein